MDIEFKVWYITGASSGIGFTLAETLLAQGQAVAGTSRKLESIQNKFKSDKFLPLQVDVTSEESVSESIKKTVEKFGKIDIIVNNAGQALFGALEECSDKELRNIFDSNFFGPMNVIRAALKYLRPQKSGVIFNVSSVAGINGGVFWGPYASSKFALSGSTEVLAKELKPLGINVCAVSPGFVRTPIHDSAPFVSGEIPEYKSRDGVVNGYYKYYETVKWADSEKLANLIINVSKEKDVPVYLMCGVDANLYAKQKLAAVTTDIETNFQRTTTDLLEEREPGPHHNNH